LAEEAVEAGEIQGDNWQLGLRLAAGALGSLHHKTNRCQPTRSITSSTSLA